MIKLAFLFDLDDTLIQTSQILIPRAFEDLSEFIENQYGLHFSGGDLRKRKRRLDVQRVRSDFFKDLSAEIGQLLDGGPTGDEIAESLKSHIYERKPKAGDVRLFDGVFEFLSDLKQEGHNLHLVTAGDPGTQRLKIELSGLSSLFIDSIEIIDHKKEDEQKIDVFRRILENSGYHPSQTVVVGDRYSNEISAGLELGLQTWWICSGEHATHLGPDQQASTFTFGSMPALIKWWRNRPQV